MPAGPQQYEEQQSFHNYDYSHQPPVDYSAVNGGDESAATILQSVKEQEAQFEQLTRELEAERQSVANQLEKCKFGSETASMSSISSTDESFKWKPPQLHDPIDEESDTDSKVSGSQLVDSCLRVLQGRGLMGNIGEDPSEYLPPKDLSKQEPQPPNNNLNEPSQSFSSFNDSSMNGPTGYGMYEQQSPNASMQGPRMVTTVTKTTAYYGDQQDPGMMHSPAPQDSYRQQSYQQANYSSGDNLYHQQDQPSRFNNDPYGGGGGAESPFPPSPHNLNLPNQHPDAQMHDGYQGLKFVEREPVEMNNPKDPTYEPLQQHSRFDSFDQQFSYRDQTDPSFQQQNVSYGNNYGDYPGSPQPPQPQYPSNQQLNDSYGYGSNRNLEVVQQSYQQTEQDRYGDRYAQQDQYNDRPNDSFNAGNYGNPPQQQEDPYGSRQDTRYLEENKYRDSPQGGSPRPDIYPTDSRYPQDGGQYRQYTEPPRGQSPALSDRGAQAYGGSQSGLSGSMQRLGIQDPNFTPSTQSHMPPFDEGQPPYNDERQDSLRESQAYSSRQNSMRDVGPYGVNDRQAYTEVRQQYDSVTQDQVQYGSRQNSIRDLGPQYDDRQNSMRDERQFEEQQNMAYGSRQNSVREAGLYGSQTRITGFDTSEPPLAQGSQDHLGPPPFGSNTPSGSQSRLNRSGDLQGSQLRLGSERGSQRQLNQENVRMESLRLTTQDGGYDPEAFGTLDQRFRDPDLPEVIEYLSHPSNAIKANAAAYLQHLCFMDDNVKAKTRSLGGIPALVELINNEIPEVHRAACGALRNLSYGRSNDENKRAIRNAGGIQVLVRLLRKSPDNDVRELVTGILWNLSSCPDLKRPIVDEGLTVLVNNVVVPHSGLDKVNDPYRQQDTYWPTVFRNASGVLRNVSSDGGYARKKLRECEGLVDSIIYIVKTAIGKNDIDNKSVENCVCILRNLSFACQEVQDPEYLVKREKAAKNAAKGDATGCFGGKSSKKDKQDKKGQHNTPPVQPYTSSRRPGEPVKGMELLWQPEVVHVYLPLLSECTNPETLEAAAGAIQNLAACDWQPSVEVRTQVRKEKAMPILVELLNLEADRVVCASATALRNLALDPKNKELIGKYAMRQLVSKLPSSNPADNEFPVSDDTICAVESTLYEVVKSNAEHARTLVDEGGVDRLMYITQSRQKYNSKVIKFAYSLLSAMWQCKELHTEYKKRGWKEQNFLSKSIAAKSSNTNGHMGATPNSTISRTGMTMGQTGYNQNTMPQISRPTPNTSGPLYTHMDDPRQTPQMSSRYPHEPDSIPMQQLGGSSRDLNQGPDPNFYSQTESQFQQGSGEPDGYYPPGSGEYPPHPNDPDYDPQRQGPPSEHGSFHPQHPYSSDPYARPDEQGSLRNVGDPYNRGPPSEHGSFRNVGDPYNRGPPSEHGSYRHQQQPNPNDPYARASEQGSFRNPVDPYGRPSEQGSFRGPDTYNQAGPPSEHGSYRLQPQDRYGGPPSDHGSFRGLNQGEYSPGGQRPPSEQGYRGDPYDQPGGGNYDDQYRGEPDRYQGDFDSSVEPRRDNYVPPGGVPLFPVQQAGSQEHMSHDNLSEPLYAKVVKENKRRTDYSSDQQGGGGGGGGQGADSWV